MYQRWLSLMLVGSLTYTLAVTPPAMAGTKAEKGVSKAEQVRAGIARLGTGTEARVTVKLKDRTRLSGFISESGPEHFVVTDLTTGATTQVAYPDVTQVRGNNLSTGAKIAIGVGIVVGVIIVLYIVRGAFCDGC
ncbi:MAG TPA: hypothetical protein VFD58_09170 [Blastocatellia bacterium]|nr:hypothetical protein [Blastocatellia bacterium]